MVGVQQRGQAVIVETRKNRGHGSLAAVLIDYRDGGRQVAGATGIFLSTGKVGNLGGKVLVVSAVGLGWR